MFVARSTIRTLNDGRVVRVGVAGSEEGKTSSAARNTSTGMPAFKHTPVQKMERYIEQVYLSGSSSGPQEEKSHRGGLEDQLLAQQAVDAESEFGGLKSISASGSANAHKLRAKEGVWRLQCFRSRGETRPAMQRENDDAIGGAMALRLFFLQKPTFLSDSAAVDKTTVPRSRREFAQLCDQRLVEQAPDDLQEVYYRLVAAASRKEKIGPVIKSARGKNFGAAVRTLRHRLESFGAAVAKLRRGLKSISEGAVASNEAETTPRTYSGTSPVPQETSNEAEVPRTYSGVSREHFESQETESEDDHVALFIAHRVGSTHWYFTGIPDVYRYYGLYAVRKNLRHTPPGKQSADDDNVSDMVQQSVSSKSQAHLPLSVRLEHLVRDASLHFVLPRTSLTPLFTDGTLSAQEVAYAYAAWKFSYHFMERGSAEYAMLSDALKDKPEAIQQLARLQSSLQMNAFTEGSILDTFYRNPDMVRYVYSDFAKKFEPLERNHNRAQSLAESGEFTGVPSSEDMTGLRKACANYEANNDSDIAVFKACMMFNACIMKTNFFKPDISAISFRLHPAFLPPEQFPDRPFGLFFVLSTEFRGFHTRFRDVSRGGIRVVKSGNAQAFASNVAHLFQEGFGLAATQQRKNKDIPEGGSKGVILLNLAHQDKATTAFMKYEDAILDTLLVPALRHAQTDARNAKPVSNGPIVDYYGYPEILFLGPDENTATVMDRASQHANARGYPYSKAISTGKTPALGGIPHDQYGMTTHSVRAYALGIQKAFGLNPGECTKVQTGGPDGDLGSNEIKMSNEKYVGIVDGSGVLYDGDGLNKEELVRLAEARIPVENYNRALLGPNGFLITIHEKDVPLPDGSIVESGLTFRNTFHLDSRVTADFFVPCGGRPAAVNISNVEQFIYGTENPYDEVGNRRVKRRFKYVVEGANLFLTQEARLACEKAEMILFKDASANKGGVTSSSLEVMAALTLNSEEFPKHMCIGEHDGEPVIPQFYKDIVAEVQSHIYENASMEFECIQQEIENAQQQGKQPDPRSVLSDKLSTKITDLSARVEDSDILWNNEKLRTKVLRTAVPSSLASLLGGADKVLSRLPENYKRALFGSRLASRFVYKYGMDPPSGSEFAFFSFVDNLLHEE